MLSKTTRPAAALRQAAFSDDTISDPGHPRNLMEISVFLERKANTFFMYISLWLTIRAVLALNKTNMVSIPGLQSFTAR